MFLGVRQVSVERTTKVAKQWMDVMCKAMEIDGLFRSASII